MNNKRWALSLLLLFLTSVLVIGGVTAVVDPYFHYHKPLPGLSYPLNNQRYQNDGILRHFDYDAIITGTSVTENFKASEFDALYGVQSVKVPLEGASLKETGDTLRRALSQNPGVTTVLRSLDGSVLAQDKDFLSYGSYPTYLTDDVLYNDVNYLLNKDTLLKDTWNVLRYSLRGVGTTTFDDYSNWMDKAFFGREAILSQHIRPEEPRPERVLTDADIAMITGNVTQNVLSLAQQYPDVEFYCFFPPYSIYYWDTVSRQGEAAYYIEACRLAAQLLVGQENIRLYSFAGEFDLVLDSDQFCDLVHFHEDVNSQILHWMREGHGLLTPENNQQHWDSVLEFYTTFDYDTLF